MNAADAESQSLEQAVAAVRMERNPDLRSTMRARCLDALRRTVPDFSDPSFADTVADFNAKNPGLLRGLEFSLVRKDGGRLLIVDANGLLDAGHVEPNKAKDMLRKVKAQEREQEGGALNSYELRRALLHASKGQIRSFEAYTVDLGYPTGRELKNYLDEPEHWIPERRRLHDRVIAEQTAASAELSDALEEKYGRKGVVVAMRGNTASGKSSVMRQMRLPERGIINTDSYKFELRTDEESADGWQNTTNFQVHDEGSMLSRKIRQEIEKIDGVSMVLDSRMQDRSDIDVILAHAERKDRVVHFVDIDAPLMVSLVRVLGRPAGGINPLVQYEGIVEGFDGVRHNRTALIRRAIADSRIKSYELYGVGEDGQLTLLARKEPAKPGGFEVKNGVLFSTAVLPSRTRPEVDRAREARIDKTLIGELVPRFRVQDREYFHRVLEGWRERGVGEITLPQAIDAHKDKLNEIPPMLDYYLRASERNLMRMSRTARGVVDTTASASKAEKMSADLTAETAAQRAGDNFREALRVLYENKDTRFEDARSVREFVESIARTINRGITAETAPPLRSEDSAKYPNYTAVADLPAAFEQFCEELAERLNDPDQDPVELAAWTDYRFNLSDHFLTDGCGKASLALSSWVMMRAGRRVPVYPPRDAYYRNSPKLRRDSSIPDREDPQFQTYLQYFRTLVPPTE